MNQFIENAYTEICNRFKKLEPQKKAFALYLKTNASVLSMVGTLLFFLALIFGIAWLFSDKDFESTVVVCSLLSSVFFSSQSIASLLYPERKPIRHMSYDEILKFIPLTDPKNDWEGVSRDWSSEYFLKEDPRLRYRARFDEKGVQEANFVDPWANNHLHPRAVGYWYELYYDGAFIDKTVLVSVDDGNALLPPPDFESNEITPYNYKVAQIHDTLNSLDKYIRKSGLSVGAPSHLED